MVRSHFSTAFRRYAGVSPASSRSRTICKSKAMLAAAASRGRALSALSSILSGGACPASPRRCFVPKGSDLLVAALENEGVDRFFGIPGKKTLDVVESTRKSSIQLILTRHEQAAAFMAATHGR